MNKNMTRFAMMLSTIAVVLVGCSSNAKSTTFDEQDEQSVIEQQLSELTHTPYAGELFTDEIKVTPIPTPMPTLAPDESGWVAQEVDPDTLAPISDTTSYEEDGEPEVYDTSKESDYPTEPADVATVPEGDGEIAGDPVEDPEKANDDAWAKLEAETFETTPTVAPTKAPAKVTPKPTPKPAKQTKTEYVKDTDGKQYPVAVSGSGDLVDPSKVALPEGTAWRHVDSNDTWVNNYKEVSLAEVNKNPQMSDLKVKDGVIYLYNAWGAGWEKCGTIKEILGSGNNTIDVELTDDPATAGHSGGF